MCYHCIRLQRYLPEYHPPPDAPFPDPDDPDATALTLAPKRTIVPLPLIRALHRTTKPYLGAWYRRRLGVMTTLLKIMNPMKKIRMDKLDQIADLFDGVEDEIEHLREGLEAHGEEPEWEWWGWAMERREKIRAGRAAKREERIERKAERERIQAEGAAGEEGGSEGGGRLMQPVVEDEEHGDEEDHEGHREGGGNGDGHGLPHGYEDAHGEWHPGHDRPSARIFFSAWKNYMVEVAAEKKAKRAYKRAAGHAVGQAAEDEPIQEQTAEQGQKGAGGAARRKFFSVLRLGRKKEGRGRQRHRDDESFASGTPPHSRAHSPAAHPDGEGNAGHGDEGHETHGADGGGEPAGDPPGYNSS
jgi:hypothetical protein